MKSIYCDIYSHNIYLGGENKTKKKCACFKSSQVDEAIDAHSPHLHPDLLLFSQIIYFRKCFSA